MLKVLPAFLKLRSVRIFLCLCLLVFLGIAVIVGYEVCVAIYRIEDTFRKPTAEEYVTAIAKCFKRAMPLKLGTKAKQVSWWNSLHEYFLGIDANSMSGVHSGVDCNDPKKTYCVLFFRGDILAYAPEQVLESKDEYLNFTLIPSMDRQHPISLLLFADGRIRTGKDYALGKPGKNGIAVIKTVPAYLQDWPLEN